MKWLAVKTRSGAVVPVLVLLIVALWFILRGDLFCVLILCCFVLVFFSVLLALRLPRLGRDSLGAFRTFVRFVLVWFSGPSTDRVNGQTRPRHKCADGQSMSVYASKAFFISHGEAFLIKLDYI